MGRYDYNTPYELAEQYYDVIIAPEKDIYWFNDSAHYPHFEEVTKFSEVMKEIKDNYEN